MAITIIAQPQKAHNMIIQYSKQIKKIDFMVHIM